MSSSDDVGSSEPSHYQVMTVVGLGVGATVGVVGHLAGLERWSLVPICAGIGGGVVSGIAWLWAASRRRRG